MQGEKENYAMEIFFDEEIRDSYNAALYYLSWLLSEEENRKDISGDAFFMEKKAGRIIIGNLYDEEFPETEIDKDVFVKFIETKMLALKKDG